MTQGLTANAATLSEIFLPDSLLEEWCKATNSYAKDKRHKDRSDRSAAIYMGIVRRPSKEDYWPPQGSILPEHRALLMGKTLHTTYYTGMYDNSDNEDSDEDNHEDGNGNGNTFAENIDDNEEEEAEETTGDGYSSDGDESSMEEETWYDAVKPFVDHVNKVSKKLCQHPSFNLSIDEMLRKFFGRSAETV